MSEVMVWRHPGDIMKTFRKGRARHTGPVCQFLKAPGVLGLVVDCLNGAGKPAVTERNQQAR